MLKRITAFLLALITVFALVGCQGGNEEVTTDAPEANTSEEITEAPVVSVDLDATALAEYVIRRPENVKNESIEASIQAAKKLRETLKADLGVDIPLQDDWHKATEELPATAKEILVGKTNRTEAQNLIASIRSKDYAIAFENDRIIITGGSDDACSKAVDYFIENYIDKANKKIKLSEHLLDVIEYKYPMGNISINGVSLKEYKIVRPKKCDLITYYTAEVISDYIFDNGGYRLEVIDDSKAETAYELLIGDTNRAASNIGISLTADQYSLSISEGKVVMQGDYRMVGAAASTLINNYFGLDGKDVDVTNLPSAPAAAEFTFKKATSGIMMIGDGMSSVHFAATIDTGVIPEFVADTLPYKAECTTASYSVLYNGKAYTDSAASATALSSGYKTINSYLGVDHNKKEKQNIRELAHESGAKTAVVTTDKITGATPGGYLCHYPDRDATAKLQAQIDTLIKNGEVNYTYGAGANNKVSLVPCTKEALSIIAT
ncbi:MAG: alkaline phosphatase, partial [Clostridia bacterium]|nr:alkaline phosphatase [Clostridia bacterium]